jgi:predicted RNase H-like HicB family nuclease
MVPQPTVGLRLRVVFHRNEDGAGYWAEVPGFPGCLTEGATLDETRANVREAFAGIVAAMQDAAALEQLPGDVFEDVSQWAASGVGGPAISGRRRRGQ